MDSVFFCLEILGVIAFSISGALVAIRSKFDIFGVLVVGVITAVGGGITRDILVGQLPPKIFDNAYLVAVAALSAVLTFVLAYFKGKKFFIIQEKIEAINNYFDALGLAVFTVMGVETTLNYGFSYNILICITMGVITGVGGGLMRDIFTRSKISIFTKHVYALASIVGATIFYILRIKIQFATISTLVGVLVIFVLRLFATKYHWELPKAHIEEDKGK
ncbi:MAG: trimeric intracellular cation channel family protein [Clostridia bacterium]|nr:trimeric intracellular cation channel family protein [Clostridia bacterium]